MKNRILLLAVLIASAGIFSCTGISTPEQPEPIAAFSAGPPADYQQIFVRDTLTDVEKDTFRLAGAFPGGQLTLYLVIDEITGTLAGAAHLEGSIDGITWIPVTASVDYGSFASSLDLTTDPWVMWTVYNITSYNSTTLSADGSPRCRFYRVRIAQTGTATNQYTLHMSSFL